MPYLTESPDLSSASNECNPHRTWFLNDFWSRGSGTNASPTKPTKIFPRPTENTIFVGENENFCRRIHSIT